MVVDGDLLAVLLADVIDDDPRRQLIGLCNQGSQAARRLPSSPACGAWVQCGRGTAQPTFLTSSRIPVSPGPQSIGRSAAMMRARMWSPVASGPMVAPDSAYSEPVSARKP